LQIGGFKHLKLECQVKRLQQITGNWQPAIQGARRYFHPQSFVSLGLAIERQMIYKLIYKDLCQQSWAWDTFFYGPGWQFCDMKTFFCTYIPWPDVSAHEQAGRLKV